ncbi:response regulator [Glaciimonas sp. PAMC28666]|uniref:response regulator n=1 Tax=Glaciimonas sp. PAMC28666 TaxID=2807626 RepID=UPI0019651B5D|nr:response regulator [Glaciimonas sp. PAMC28666]QRX83622.1 response regulator [Glaciimonas sp. PAMC28666]
MTLPSATQPSTALVSIMYVEDDPDIQSIARLALESIGGFDVTIFGSGKEALAAINNGNRPDLILLDVMMPEMDGISTLTALRALPASAKTPTIFMTAKAQPHEIAFLRSLGALDVIAKPFDPMLLAQLIRKLWSKK